MNGHLKDLLLIQSFSLDGLIEEYRLFFLALLPGIFIMAVIIEYFDRMNVEALVKRALISIVILTSITSFYKTSIMASIDAANEKLISQKRANILLYDLFDVDRVLNSLEDQNKKDFYSEKNYLTGTLSFIKENLFTTFINDGFTTVVYFITQLCIQIIKVVFSLVYYLGYGLAGVPCLIYLFPTMGNVLRGAILSYIWCLIVPHILVFILSMIGSEIAVGYTTGQIIGGSATGTVLLFILTLLIAFTPLIAMMIVNGSGMAQAGGIIASIGANYVLNMPKSIVNDMAKISTGQKLGPKMTLAVSTASQSKDLVKKGANKLKSYSPITNNSSSKEISNNSTQNTNNSHSSSNVSKKMSSNNKRVNSATLKSKSKTSMERTSFKVSNTSRRNNKIKTSEKSTTRTNTKNKQNYKHTKSLKVKNEQRKQNRKH